MIRKFGRKESCFFFFNDTATTEIYTLSLHDALPISAARARQSCCPPPAARHGRAPVRPARRSEEHTSELQSQSNLVCRLLLEKKNNIQATSHRASPSCSLQFKP